MTDLSAADRLHEGLLKGAADSHDFTGRLHLRAEGAFGVYEFIERPFREFQYDVVDGGLKARAGLTGHGVLDLIQRISDGYAGSDLRDRIAGSLGGKGGGARYSRVHLDDLVLETVGIKGELAVAAAFDA